MARVQAQAECFDEVRHSDREVGDEAERLHTVSSPREDLGECIGCEPVPMIGIDPFEAPFRVLLCQKRKGIWHGQYDAFRVRTTGGTERRQKANWVVDVFKDFTQQECLPFLLCNFARKSSRQVCRDEIRIAVFPPDGGDCLVIEIDADAAACCLRDATVQPLTISDLLIDERKMVATADMDDAFLRQQVAEVFHP